MKTTVIFDKSSETWNFYIISHEKNNQSSNVWKTPKKLFLNMKSETLQEKHLKIWVDYWIHPVSFYRHFHRFCEAITVGHYKVKPCLLFKVLWDGFGRERESILCFVIFVSLLNNIPFFYADSHAQSKYFI